MRWGTPRGTDLEGSRLRVLLAVVAEHEQHGRATVKPVARRVCMSTSTVHKHLLRLRDDGWVQWESGRAGTLRPTVGRVGHASDELTG